MAGNPHPVFVDNVPPEKASARADIVYRLGSTDDVRGTDLSGSYAIFVSSKGSLYKKDTSDTTSLDDGNLLIRDANGVAWRKTGGTDGLDGQDGATIIFQSDEPSTDYPAGSLWIDEDSPDLDLYALGGSPLSWADTGKNLKGADGAGAVSSVNTKTGDVLIEEIIHDALEKTTPDDTDEFALNQRVDSPASNTLKKLKWANLKSFFLASTIARREVLTTNRTYYVRTDGSDSNNGLSNSSGGAFLTPQKAWDVAVTLDLARFGVTIQIGDGTYTGGLSMSVPPVGGNISVVGNTSTPGNVVFSTTSKDAISLSCPLTVSVSGIKVATTTSGFGIHSQAAGGKIALGAGMQFGACAQPHMFAENGGIISCFSAYTINGAASGHFTAQKSGIIDLFGYTVTLSGSLNFSTAFAIAQTTGIVSAPSLTFTGGTITGTRYLASLNGLIDTSGGGASYFPGSVAGSTSTGGQYA